MPTTNIKIFDENKANIMSDTDYASAAQRLNGVQAGIASSALQNKTLLQTSIICYAVAQLMVNNGFDALDTATTTVIANNLASSVMGKVSDRATQAEATAGTSAVKWISPLTLSQVFEGKKATQGEVTSLPASNDTHWTSPLNLQQFFNSRAATDSDIASRTTTKWVSPAGLYTWFQSAPVKGSSADINIGTESNKWVPASSIKTWFDSFAKASTLDAQGGTNDAKWMSALKVKQAIDKFVPASSIGTVYNQNKQLGTLRTLDIIPSVSNFYVGGSQYGEDYDRRWTVCETVNYVVWLDYDYRTTDNKRSVYLVVLNKKTFEFKQILPSNFELTLINQRIYICSSKRKNESDIVYIRYYGLDSGQYITYKYNVATETRVKTIPYSKVTGSNSGIFGTGECIVLNVSLDTNTTLIDIDYLNLFDEVQTIRFATYQQVTNVWVTDYTDDGKFIFITNVGSGGNYPGVTYYIDFNQTGPNMYRTVNVFTSKGSAPYELISLFTPDKKKITSIICKNGSTSGFYKQFDVSGSTTNEIETTFRARIDESRPNIGVFYDHVAHIALVVPYNGQGCYYINPVNITFGPLIMGFNSTSINGMSNLCNGLLLSLNYMNKYYVVLNVVTGEVYEVFNNGFLTGSSKGDSFVTEKGIVAGVTYSPPNVNYQSYNFGDNLITGFVKGV